MSTGGVFKLIANDGKADRMIMATELLSARIKDIMCMRAKQGYADPTPTLVDIERTHILFVNARFKPFAALACEYNKVRSNTGNAQYGGNVQFSIQQFGDLFADMVVNTVIAQTQATVGTVPALPAHIGADNQGYLDVNGVFTPGAPAIVYGKRSGTNNVVSQVYTQYTQQYVDNNDVPQAVGGAATNFVRYCEFPGARLFKRTKFDVNSNPLDEYSSDAYVYYEQCELLPNKREGWKRLMGQEVPVDAYGDHLMSIAGTSGYPASVTGINDSTGSPAVGVPVNASFSTRKRVGVCNGPQTPQLVQPALELWTPLIFWFNKDPSLSIASVAIPYGQRYITIDLEAQNNILFVAPGNLFYKVTIEKWFSAGAGAGTQAAVAVTDYQIYVKRTPTLAAGSVIDATQQITTMDLYTNNIFVNADVHDIYIKRIGFNLIRVHRFQTQREQVSTDSVQLVQLKWPIEYFFFGLRPTANIDPNNPNQYRDWHRFNLLQDNSTTITSKAHAKVTIDDGIPFNDVVGTKIKKSYAQEQVENIVYPSEVPTWDTLGLQVHGIDVFKDYKRLFYNSYLPFTAGGINLTPPSDTGIAVINFCLHPGTYQPSGHLNVSRAREFYIKYVSSYVSSSTPADIIVVASAINFILIADGSAVLRYST